ncbi:protein of unknown function [Burkholderia multivorans]
MARVSRAGARRVGGARRAPRRVGMGVHVGWADRRDRRDAARRAGRAQLVTYNAWPHLDAPADASLVTYR